MRLLTTFALITAACGCGAPNVALAKSSNLDPGVLESVETHDGTTTQKYSDGLIVKISAHRISVDDNNFGMFSEMPDNFRRYRREPMVDSFIRDLIDMECMRAREPNSSREQALLRYFSDYYLEMQEPNKAEPLAERYLQTQIAMDVKGEPLAHAQRTLGAAKVGLGKYNEAAPLLRVAAKFYETSDDRLTRWQVLKDLARALAETGQTEEGLKCLKESKELETENQFIEPTSKPPDYEPPAELSRGITPTGAGVTVRHKNSK